MGNFIVDIFTMEFSGKSFEYKFTFVIPEWIQIGRAKLLLAEDIDGKFKRACVAEFIAMVFFVTMCCGCAMVVLNMSDPNLMMVAARQVFGNRTK